MSEAEKHIALLVEIPAIFTEDLGDLREYRGATESPRFPSEATSTLPSSSPPGRSARPLGPACG